MTDFIVNDTFGQDFTAAGRWNFYTEDYIHEYYYAEKGGSGIDFSHPIVNTDTYRYYASFANIDGVGIKVKQSETKSDGSPGYKMTAGTVTSISFYYEAGAVTISGTSIDAKELDSLMRQHTAKSAQKIFDLLSAGDDDATLSISDDTFSAGAGDDVIRGRSGRDTLNGGAGDDLLYGGTGKDTLTGGKGADIFVFDVKASAANADTIEDFSTKDDMISLDHHFFRALGHAGELSAKAFWSSTTGKAADKDDHILYNTKTGDLSYDADGSGKGGAIVFAHLDSGLKMTAADFDVF